MASFFDTFDTIGVTVESTDENLGEQISHTRPKRPRIHLSCTHCRHAKLKCDREHPCNQCIKRDRQIWCTYTPPPVRHKQPKKIQDRLKHLEGLVKNLITDGPSAQQSLPAANPQADLMAGLTVDASQKRFEAPRCPRTGAAAASGQVVIGNTETTFVGATHWAAILEDIEEVKTYFNDEEEDHESDEGQDLFSGDIILARSSRTRADLIAALPPRSIVDKLVSRYFHSDTPVRPLIHRLVFQKEYQEFWNDPESKPVIWLGLLYGMLCLATCFIASAGEAPLETRASLEELVAHYRRMCADCLLLSNYTKPGQYTLETFLLYITVDVVRGGLVQSKTWLQHGLAIRLALRMGFHRDASNHPNISVFQGEMRRRIWHALVQIDLLLSFHLGLPNMTGMLQTDTRFPHNLLDVDFSWDSKSLPPERPPSEPTDMAYMICKSRICHVFGKIAEQANSIIPPTHKEVMAVDEMLTETYSKIPPYLLIRPLDEAVTDSHEVIIQRFNIILLFHKSRCVLHRQHLLKHGPDQETPLVNVKCLDSAMELLHHQSSVFDATQRGGSLHDHQWFIYSLAAHDFLLGAMILYLCLSYKGKQKPGKPQSSTRLQIPQEQRKKMIEALQTSQRIWLATESERARKASRVLTLMLANLKVAGEVVIDRESNNGPDGLDGTNDSWPETIPGISKTNYLDVGLWNPDTEDPMSSELQRAVFENNFDLPRIPTTSTISPHELDAMLETPLDLDWGQWDNQINGNTESFLPEDGWESQLNIGIPMANSILRYPTKPALTAAQEPDLRHLHLDPALGYM